MYLQMTYLPGLQPGLEGVFVMLGFSQTVEGVAIEADLFVSELAMRHDRQLSAPVQALLCQARAWPHAIKLQLNWQQNAAQPWL